MITRNHTLFTIDKITRGGALGTAALAAALGLNPTSVKADDAAPPSRIHELINFEFASEYVTPRGMMVHDQGLTFQPLALTLVDLYSGGSFISSVGLDFGAWNDFGTHGTTVVGTSQHSAWTEIDPIAGISIGIMKKLELDLNYSAFAEQIGIGTDQNFEIKLGFDDSDYLKAYALHPYVSMWNEVGGSKSTDADVPYSINPAGARPGAKHPGPGISYYIDLGIDPTYTFKNVLGGLKLEAPCRIMFPDDRFYGDYYSSSSAVGIWELGLKGTIPLNFVPAGYGHWSFHAGINFLYFQDDNLVQLEQFLDGSGGKPTHDTLQGFGGVSVFF